MARVWRMLLVVCGALMGGYALICLGLFVFQRKLIFPAPRDFLMVRDGSTRVELPNGTFFLWHQVPGEGPVVVHFHGNGEQVAHLSWLGQAWAIEKASFVAVEYPGYPGTAGTPSEASFFSSAQLALEHLTQVLKVDPSRLILEGQSIGSGVAVAMAARGWGKRLILISPYTSLVDVAAEAFPLVPVRWLLLDHFDSLALAKSVHVPTLIVHGTDDELIPFTQGQALSRAMPGSTLVPVVGGHHNDVWDDDQARFRMFEFANQ